jgi:Zn-dependent protease with chaperone function
VNFFERQQAARGTTLRLVALFVIAIVAIVAVIDAVVVLLGRNQSVSTLVSWVIVASIITVVIIAVGMISKTISLRSGGSAVALSVGAVPVDPTTTDPALRRYVNIVEEMSLASGVPTPRLFVLEREPGINAFAAGYTPADAAITVTGGALRQLNRDELQGVIGHEFSHVLNGDMRLNVRLIGLLNGILLLGLIGLRFFAFGGGRGDRKGGANVLIAVAIAMTVLGFVGQFFAGLIKAAVSRQREWLADASAVQFTRQTAGLEGALKKIAGLPVGSALEDTRSAREVSHMLFGEGTKSFSALFATHPPLFDRIHALDPSFTQEQLAELSRVGAEGTPEAVDQLIAQRTPLTSHLGPMPAPRPVAVQPSEIALRAGTMTAEDLQRGAALSAQIPPQFRQLAAQSSTTVPLVLAMLVGAEPTVRARQLAIVAQRLGPGVAQPTGAIADELSQLPEVLRLPVTSIALPQLAGRSREEVRTLLATLNDLALADGSISLFEYCLTRVVWSYLQDALDPVRRSRIGSATLAQAKPQVDALLESLDAVSGTPSPARLAGWQTLDEGWPVLDALAPPAKQQLVEQMVAAVLADGKLAAAEAELLRAACGVIHVPLPVLVA